MIIVFCVRDFCNHKDAFGVILIIFKEKCFTFTAINKVCISCHIFISMIYGYYEGLPKGQ